MDINLRAGTFNAEFGESAVRLRGEDTYNKTEFNVVLSYRLISSMIMFVERSHPDTRVTVSTHGLDVHVYPAF